jgi:hypothetical protein
VITPISGNYAELYQGSRWVLEVRVTDDDGRAVESLPDITAIFPGGDETTPAPENLGHGFYRAALTVTEAGTYVAVFETDDYGVAAFRANVTSLADPFANMPDLAEVKTYLGITDSSKDALVTDALNAETEDQEAKCRVPVVYPIQLGQALKRRVARNLALRGIPLAVLQGDAEVGSLTLPGRDPEVRRLEAPFRKLVQP